MTAFEYDVTSRLSEIKAPTLVIHRRDDRAVPFEQGREIAAGIPGARFVPLEGDSHVLYWDHEPVAAAIERFLLGEEAPHTPVRIEESLRTILFTDMDGSTALTQRLGDAKAQEVLSTHNRMIRTALADHGGSEIKHTGDGIMVSFPATSKALQAAIAIQRLLRDHNREHPEAPIRVRIGLNAGEPVAEDGDLFGTTVQLAARICAHAEPGQILASNVVEELAAGKDFTFAQQDKASLKGFTKPVRLHEVSWDD
jgi:class 3 adenylate cyclase